MAQTKSVLLVDANPQESRALFTALVRAGHTVADTHRSDYALELLADRSFEVAIIDLLSLGMENDELIQKLAEDWSNPLIVGIADFADLVARQTTLRRGVHSYMGKPVDIRQLQERVAADGPAASGHRGADTMDYLRCIAETGRNAKLEIRGLNGNCCRLFVSDRTVIHAVCGNIEGQAALFESLGFEGGSFSHMPWSAPERITMTEPMESLFARALEPLNEP